VKDIDTDKDRDIRKQEAMHQ